MDPKVAWTSDFDASEALARLAASSTTNRSGAQPEVHIAHAPLHQSVVDSAHSVPFPGTAPPSGSGRPRNTAPTEETWPWNDGHLLLTVETMTNTLESALRQNGSRSASRLRTAEALSTSSPEPLAGGAAHAHTSAGRHSVHETPYALMDRAVAGFSTSVKVESHRQALKAFFDSLPKGEREDRLSTFEDGAEFSAAMRLVNDLESAHTTSEQWVATLEQYAHKCKRKNRARLNLVINDLRKDAIGPPRTLVELKALFFRVPEPAYKTTVLKLIHQGPGFKSVQIAEFLRRHVG